MMIVGIDAGPRKNYNIGKLFNAAIESATESGATVEIYHLYSIKNINLLTDIIKKIIHEADAVIFASPVYFCRESAELAYFFDELFLPLRAEGIHTLSLKKAGYIEAMNWTAEQVCLGQDSNSPWIGREPAQRISNIITKYLAKECRIVRAFDTLQVRDYSAYQMDRWDPIAKKAHHDMMFPLYIDSAKNLGRWLATA